MKAIITGASGAVGSALTHHLTENGHTAIAWNRAEVTYTDYAAMEAYLRHHQPDVLFHLAVASASTGRDNEGWWVTYHWTSELAWLCRQLNIRFVFTGTVMVYSNNAPGPFTPATVPDVTEGYGYEKLQAEQRAFSQNPDTIVARLGWQIGDAPGFNNMVDFLERQQREQGEIRASRKWFPACSFVQDTAAALTALATFPAGLYLVNSNTRWSFYDIASALNEVHGNRWVVTLDDNFVYDQRMMDERVPIAPLDQRLPGLKPRG
jgi:dTDP-4-dehydrorhamnose reductase